MPLQLPAAHFLCMHSYHTYCLEPPDYACRICAPELAAKMMLREQRQRLGPNESDQFFKFLRGATDGFTHITSYFGRGAMSNEVMRSDLFVEDDEDEEDTAHLSPMETHSNCYAPRQEQNPFESDNHHHPRAGQNLIAATQQSNPFE
eukprot:GHVN01048166.1.p1 GENE.GHVN01048166.1~~GHVN01048166.1.p1  ORF type:complete len:168 (-),score=31.35 GHVN01048166.1:81-521(-)